MGDSSIDVFVAGGGVNGAAIARDAAGRGLSVMLAEQGDYAEATSSASSNLIHGGLRYLETWQFGLVRQSLREREGLMRAAPYLAQPLQFLVPIRPDQKRPSWMVRAGLQLYDLLAGRSSLPASGRLQRTQINALPHLRAFGLSAVLNYYDCHTDDARLVLALLLDARRRGANIANRRRVVAVRSAANGYRVTLDERGNRSTVEARFLVNATGPWVNSFNEISDAAPPGPPVRLVRGSHIVLAMPQPALTSAYTLQNDDERVVFTLPWLGDRFLVIGTTDIPHEGPPDLAACSDEERDYLLDVYNRYFEHPQGPARSRDVVWSWSGVRTLVDDGNGSPSKASREAELTWRSQGSGGYVSVYGGKLTTHRDLAENVVDRLRRLGCNAGPPWTYGAILPGGHFSLAELSEHADAGPHAIAPAVRRRWTHTYGDRVMELYDRVSHRPKLASEIAAGVPEAELEHAVETEDAKCAEDFLLRRTKLNMLLSTKDRKAVERWFSR